MIAAKNSAAKLIRLMAESVRSGEPLYESTRNAVNRLKPTSDDFRREWFAALTAFNQAQAAAMRLSPSAKKARIAAAASTLEDSWRSAIRRGYERAFRLGYGSRGRSAARLTSRQISEIEPGFDALVQDQARWAMQFAQQYASGELQAPRRMGVGPRSNLYAKSLKSAYNAGAVAGGRKGEKIAWKLGACDHCPDCPILAMSGPYTRNTLPTYPGSGRTKCATNCCCHLVFLGGREPEVDAPDGQVSGFADPAFDAPRGMSEPTAVDVAFLRDLELRRNFARRRVAELEDGPEKADWARALRELQGEMNDYRRERRIRWVPRFSVGDALTKTDIALKDIDDIFLRGIDGYTVYKADLRLLDKLISDSNEALIKAVRGLSLPPSSPVVPSGASVITIKTASDGADPDASIGDALSIDEANRGRESRATLSEDVSPPPVEPLWTVNILGPGIQATLENHIALLGELRESGPYFLQVGPFDGDWPMIVSVTGSWIRGDSGEVKRLLLNLKDSDAVGEFAIAPLVGAQ